MKKALLLFLLCGFVLGVHAQKSITLDDCFTYFKFYPEYGGDFNYAPDGLHYWVAENGGIDEYDVRTGEKSRSFIEPEALAKVGEWESFQFNADQTMVLLKTNVEKVYRHSELADYWIYDVKNKQATPLNEGEKVQFAVFSPEGKSIAFVVRNNLYIKDLARNKTNRITNDGALNKIRNGIPDWVYEEEFSPVTGEGMVATKWSPDGNQLAFIRFDETKVPAYTMNFYTGRMYPEQDSFKYPKVGAPNSTVSVHLYNLNEHTTSKIMGLEADDYVPRLHWTQDNQLIITRLNRLQDTVELLVALPGRSILDESDNINYIPVRPLLQETNKSYVDIHDNLVFLKDKAHYLWSTEQSGFNQLYLYSLDNKTGIAPVPLTQPGMDMTTFYGVDEQKGKFYYQTASPSPLYRQVWEGDLKGGAPIMLSKGDGTWEARFSPTFDYYTLQWSEANTPPTVNLHARGGEKIRAITDNTRVRKAMKDYGFVDKTFWSFKLADGTELNGWMLKPANMIAGKKYPVLFDVYGGPGSQTVQDQYDGYMDPWRQMLVQKGIIVVSVDNRGTGARGEAFKKCTQLQLGKYETEDQIAAARYLATQSFVDPLRIGIWGWSFGGYLSTSCILKGNTVFNMAMAVAPVTNWKWYDSAYTERYMHTGKDNSEGYESNSPVNFAHLLRGGNYLICHGIADDNVHWQQTVEMINALIKSNKQFETHYYPNRNHGIYGDNATLHLFSKLTQFVQDKL